MASIVTWLVGGLVVAAIGVPLVRWFWFRYDKPTPEMLEAQRQQKEMHAETKVWMKMEAKLAQEQATIDKLKQFGLHAPLFKFKNTKEFVANVQNCVNYLNLTTEVSKRIPDKIIIAMADVESASGTSRFATEGNALFGVRTWDLKKVPHMKPGAIPNASFGVKKYKNKCASVADVIDILNRHPAYKDFRAERNKQLSNTYWNYDKLVPLLAPWSTNPDYGKIILKRMKELKL